MGTPFGGRQEPRWSYDRGQNHVVMAKDHMIVANNHNAIHSIRRYSSCHMELCTYYVIHADIVHKTTLLTPILSKIKIHNATFILRKENSIYVDVVHVNSCK